MLTSHFVTHGPVTTAYYDEGEGDPFLLVHGYTGSKLDFRDQLSWFGDLRRVIAYDQRGHGESSNVQPYDFDALVTDLLRLMDALEIERCDLLGHSMGGMVALRAALATPGRFDSLILMDTAASALPGLPRRVRRRLYKLVTEEGCAALLRDLRDMSPSPAEQRGIDFLGEAEHWRRMAVKLEQMDPLAFTELGPLLREHPPVLDQLSGLDCPATVIVGEHDTEFVEPSAQMAERLPRGRLVTIPDAAHSPQYENAEAWREAVRAHLANGHER